MSDALNIEVLIQVEGEDGSVLFAHVQIFGIGRNVATEIRTSRRPTEGEEQLIHAALEEIVSRETGRPAITADSEHFTDVGEMQKSKRKHLGGGQG
jgi:hypothetical protein